MKALLRDYGPLGERLGQGPYAEAALVPASPWLGDAVPGRANVVSDANARKITLNLGSKTPPWLWIVQSHRDGSWHLQVVPGTMTSIEIEPGEEIAVSMLSRTGVQGPAAMIIASE